MRVWWTVEWGMAYGATVIWQSDNVAQSMTVSSFQKKQ